MDFLYFEKYFILIKQPYLKILFLKMFYWLINFHVPAR